MPGFPSTKNTQAPALPVRGGPPHGLQLRTRRSARRWRTRGARPRAQTFGGEAPWVGATWISCQLALPIISWGELCTELPLRLCAHDTPTLVRTAPSGHRLSCGYVDDAISS